VGNSGEVDFLEYFSSNASSWTSAAHSGVGGYFPLAQQRAHLALQSIEKMAGREGADLDFGCGPGVFAAALASAGFDVVGIDFSSDMLELALANPDV